MIRIYDRDTSALVGEITDPQLQFLVGHLEEESVGDQDYYINAAALEWLVEEGAEPGLVDVLRKALGDRDGVEIRWEHA